MNIKLADEFPLDEGICYLNHAAVSPWPLRTAEAIKNFASENIHQGARHYPLWEQKEAELRQQLRKLLQVASSEDIALVKNTSEGLSMIAYGLTWQAGDEILISDEEFPSNRIVWESLASQGVRVKELPLNGEAIEEQIASHFSDRSRMLAISSIQYASGTRLDLEKLGKLCQQAGIIFCVDAIQSLGAYTFNQATNHADFVVADGHKWLMAPEGVAVFYSNPKLREKMQVHEYGWHMVEDAGNYQSKQWQAASSARLFECGSPNMMGIHGLSASLSLIEEFGIHNIERMLSSKANYLRERLLALPGCTLHTSPWPQYQSAIINFSISGKDKEVLRQQLMDKGVVCVCRGEGIRFSPHFYTPESVLDRAVDILESLL